MSANQYPATTAPAAVLDASAWCPCGHWVGGDYACLNGLIYGPCGDPHCTGACDDTHGTCKSDGCLCQEEA